IPPKRRLARLQVFDAFVGEVEFHRFLSLLLGYGKGAALYSGGRGMETGGAVRRGGWHPSSITIKGRLWTAS
ncbi:hypothetical protein, partial [Cardiobacterium hominis]|uniref:hypothetical protein n=1 Tax=Cardiobacterium hominis TaxID=2718 RepID=UPI0028EED3C4